MLNCRASREKLKFQIVVASLTPTHLTKVPDCETSYMEFLLISVFEIFECPISRKFIKGFKLPLLQLL